jgi:hypothetical protein
MPNVGFNMGIISKIFESQNPMTKMYQKDKLHTLKMKENDSVTKHIHIFRCHLEQLLVASTIIVDDEVVLLLMRSMPPSYKTFINSLRK